MTRQDISAFRRSYNCVLPDCPRIGSVTDAQMVLALSFGRNSIVDSELGTILKHHGAIIKDDLTVFRQLHRSYFNPGAANMRLAWQAAIITHEYRLPFYGQWEVAYAMWMQFREHYERLHTNERAVVFWPTPDNQYASSWDVLNYLLGPAGIGLRTKQAVLAHDYHIARIVAMCWKLGYHPITIGPITKVMDPESIQPWTRRMWGLNPHTSWLPRELGARHYHHPRQGWVELSPSSA